MGHAWELISKSDLLVLPSYKDGWGVVINEALMAGVPVVCSTNCGAQDLLDGCIRGETFEVGNAKQLAEVLRRRIGVGPNGAETRRDIQEWSRRISAESAASYLKAIVDHVYAAGPRPMAPWLQ
jgi:glycosyltransferase involved in cell wall biosynthesis